MTRTEEITFIVEGLETSLLRHTNLLRHTKRVPVKISSNIDSICRAIEIIEAEIKEYGAEQLNINLAS